MSTTDGPDVNDLDRGEQSLDRDRHTADSSFGTRGGGRTIGSPIQLSEKLVGCGCFGCSSLIVFAGCVVLLVLVAGFLIPDWRSNNRYIASSGVVLDKKLDSQWFDVAGPRGQPAGKQESYRPNIKIRYEVEGRKFESWSYDATGNHSPDRAAQQAIVDSFQVGATYPCWYDPDRPERAVLVRGHNWGAYVFLIVPLALLAIGGAGMWIARIIASSRPGPVASGGSPPRGSTVPLFWERLQDLVTPRGPFDPSRIGDPLAMKTEWSPLKNGGSSNFRIRKLVEVDPNRLEFRATTNARVFALGFFLPGVLVFFVALKGVVSGLSTGTINLNGFMGLPFGLLFCACGGAMFYYWTIPIVFDGRRGLFWKGRKEPDEGDSSENATSFRAIHALQLIPTRGSQSGGYEINLVLGDGERLNVLADSGVSRNRFREDATILAGFLGKPVWDAL